MAKKGNIIDVEHYNYKRIKFRKGKDGKAQYSAGNQDAVAISMLGAEKADLIKIMNDNKLGEELGKHSRGKNVGHFRMILGQALRGKVNREEPVKINGNTITKLTQKVEPPKGVTIEPIKPREKGAGGGAKKKRGGGRKKKAKAA
jgi:hypothetical protein